MHFVAALDRIPGMRCVLSLQENVVTGAADGYYRITGKPAATLLHCGPGLANGLANLHNARRARSGIVNIVGDQATYHRPLDAPLTADVESWARPVSSWVRTATTADRVGGDAAAAVAPPERRPAESPRLFCRATPRGTTAALSARQCRCRRHRRSIRMSSSDPPACCGKKNVLLLLGGKAVHERAQRLVWRRGDDRRQADDREGSNAPYRTRARPPAAGTHSLCERACGRGAGSL